MNPKFEHKTRAIRTKDHRIRDYVKRKVVKVLAIAGVNNPADLFTKIVKEKQAFKKHCCTFMNEKEFLENRTWMMNLRCEDVK